MSGFEQSKSTGLSELHAVVAVAQHRSFRRAAAELGVSASALSHSIAGLEQRLGVKLFHRTTRSVSLSEEGTRFVGRVQPALGAIVDAFERADDPGTAPSGTLRINTSLAAARWLFEPFVLPFLARYPRVRVDIVTDGRLVDIVAGGFDAGVRPADLVPKDMVAVPCSPPLRFVVVGSPAYFARRPKPRTPDDLTAHACVRRRLPSGAPLRWELAKGRRKLELDVDGALTVDSDELAVTAALRGVALAWANSWSVERWIAEKRLVTVLDDWCPTSPGICVYYPPHRHVPPVLKAFVELVKERRGHLFDRGRSIRPASYDGEPSRARR